MSLLNALKPVYDGDLDEWQCIVEQNKSTTPSFFWYGGAAGDILPYLALVKKEIPNQVSQNISPNIIPFFTDYSKDIGNAFKVIYHNFDNPNIDLMPEGNYWFSHQFQDVSLKQMIPLTLFDREAIDKLRLKYTSFNHYLPDSCLPDEQWHMIYFELECQGYEFSLFYGLIENLVFWKEVIEPFKLNVEVFCALRVGGKSGSWEFIHQPQSQLFMTINKSNIIKPKFWIADDCAKLREIWEEVEPHENGFYGQMHYFKTNW